MALKDINLNIDFNQIAEEFRGLNPNDPGAWPLIPRITLLIGVVAATLGLGHYLFILDKNSELENLVGQEQTLRQEFQDKYSKAVNLDALKKQKEEVNQDVVTLERQLPSKAEMDALLSDINQAGIGRGLQFELFKPGQVAVKEYYAELPIDIRVTGTYHDVASFASDLSNMPRIVTLNSINLIAGKEKEGATLTLDAVAKTFRYLDPDEVAAKRNQPKPPMK
ncbi:type 4a pilus biogenesis protein PilO [Parvibium lacunae]|uniref:Pilus assembly protein PilO n=1 Tax=Parvibium lacunae TaxID=1888893 RepID=A0A368KYU6_9BURK|nr:type 4a pilus biogenesis protein PilO [Parvibium lacunae]RCS56588.1 pilus assembly protein PilO [Parvibium lacunae]